MVLIIFGEEIHEIDVMPEKYEDFIEFIDNLFGINEISKFYLEFSIDNKITKKLDIETYNEFFQIKERIKLLLFIHYLTTKKLMNYKIKKKKLRKIK